MCGILGVYSRITDSSDVVDMTERLIRQNESRGVFSIGLLSLCQSNYRVNRHLGRFNREDRENLLNTPNLLGVFCHLRAPTGRGRTVDYCHPLETDRFLLAHNGILLNHRDLIRRLSLSQKLEVDSWAIVAGIQKLVDDGLSVTSAITSVASVLRGQFACWLLDKETRDLYLFRQMSPVFLSLPFLDDMRAFVGIHCEGFVFSSTPYEGMTHEMSEGMVMRFSNNILTPVGSFEVNRHFLAE